MFRRDFIELLWTGAAGLPFFNSVFNCSDGDEKFARPKWRGTVIVVGAGAAGLYATYLLKKAGVGVTLLEASPRVGGRIRTLKNFADFPVELGAEYVNGEKNILHKLAKKSAVELYPAYGKNSRAYFSVGDKLLREDQAEKNADVQTAYRLFGEIADYRSGAKALTVAQFLDSRAVAPNAARLCRLIGIEAGASNERVNLAVVARMAKTFLLSEGEQAFRPRTPYLDILGVVKREIENEIRYETAVEKIDYSAEQITISAADGKNYRADKAIITVPLPVLQKKMIKFVPALPEEKIWAIEDMRFGAGMKVILKFRRAFWQPDVANVAGGAFATYWQPLGNTFGRDKVLTAFAVGEHAEKLAGSETRTVKLLLGELDNLFGNQAATTNFLDSQLINWSNEPFIGGYVAYPNSSRFFDDKAALAKSVQNKLFFAGEATNTDETNIGYVHGAAATSAKAVQELINTLAKR